MAIGRTMHRVNGQMFCVRKPRDVELFLVVCAGANGDDPRVEYQSTTEERAEGVCEYLAQKARAEYHNTVEV